MPPSVVYAAGYAGQKFETLRLGTIALGATVVDIRFAPLSRKPEWRRSAMEAALDGRYLWLQQWGNENYNEPSEGICISDFAGGMARFEALSGPVILLCRCSNYQTCHRAAIARLIEPRGYPVKFFTWDDYVQESSLF